MQICTHRYHLNTELSWFDFVFAFVNRRLWNVSIYFFCEIFYAHCIMSLKKTIYPKYNIFDGNHNFII